MPNDDVNRVHDAWEKNAAWWDDYIGPEGNTFHRELIAPAQLRSLGDHHFDASVCTMALMDIPEIDPLLATLPSLLKPGGRFVFSVMHPCFNSMGAPLLAEEDARDGELVTKYAVKVVSYLDVPAQRGVGIAGQPEPHVYFHRPLHELLGVCFQAGFVMDGIEEPAFSLDSKSDRSLGWQNISQISPVLVVRLRVAG